MNGYNGMLRMFHNAYHFGKLEYKRYAYIHRHYTHHHGCMWHYILILAINTSLTDLQEALENGKDMFAVMLTYGFSSCLLFAKSKKDKSSKIKLELEGFNENEVEKYFSANSIRSKTKTCFYSCH